MMTHLVHPAISLFLCSFVCYYQIAQGLLYEELGGILVALINLLQTTWKAQINLRFIGLDESIIQQFTGIKDDFLAQHPWVSSFNDELPEELHNRLTRNVWWNETGAVRNKRQQSLPANFDWRDHSNCQSLFQIRNQTCGDCYAVAVAAAISDRVCLYTSTNKYFSARHISSCVYSSAGCNGGYPQDVAKFYMNTGVASGNDPYVNAEPSSCLTYPNPNSNSVACPSTCDNGATLDSTKGVNFRQFNNANDIMNEIYSYGPVVVVFQVYQDFGYMGTGVYQHVYGNSLGYHSVRLIGWGVDSNGVAYWQAANQWGTKWGDSGYFKILRGSDHCGIEDFAIGVYPAEAWNTS